MALTGRAALVALLAVPLVLLAPGGGVGVLAVAGLLLMAAAVDLTLAGSARGLVLTRSGATTARLGEEAPVVLLVANPGRRRVRGLVRDAWPPTAAATPRRQRLDVPAGERRRMTTVLHPTRRGDRHAARVTVRSVGPLGLAARQGSHAVPWTVRVLPPFASRRHLPERLARLRRLDGLVLARGRGQGTEFDSLRDYVAGDDVRSIDWRASARRDAVVVRTWRPERDRHVLVVLDTGRTAAARVRDATRLDAAMDATLLLAALASRAGDGVDLLAYDRRVRASVTRTSRTDVLPRLVQALATLEPALVEPDAQGLAAAVLARARHRSLVVLFTGLDPAVVEEALLAVLTGLAARHVVLVAAVTDPEVERMARRRGDPAAVYAAAAAERALGERRRVAALLRRAGVEVVDAAPHRIAPAVADAYLALKTAGRL
ncbi:MAG TPA: DUF58 domain-containing protein [Mycobacteriales bacterium]|nr:DUF58 domain-containing protein [Mycobacteriales bacterium]